MSSPKKDFVEYTVFQHLFTVTIDKRFKKFRIAIDDKCCGLTVRVPCCFISECISRNMQGLQKCTIPPLSPWIPCKFRLVLRKNTSRSTLPRNTTNDRAKSGIRNQVKGSKEKESLR